MINNGSLIRQQRSHELGELCCGCCSQASAMISSTIEWAECEWQRTSARDQYNNNTNSQN